MEKDSTAAEEFIDEQFLDVIRGDTHKILSEVDPKSRTDFLMS